jgi:hypothetical protein
MCIDFSADHLDSNDYSCGSVSIPLTQLLDQLNTDGDNKCVDASSRTVAHLWEDAEVKKYQCSCISRRHQHAEPFNMHFVISSSDQKLLNGLKGNIYSCC